ncbi:hypothetical protein ANCCAN_27569 [Ancylostoma caninum]|uniref:Uncharacterized protein n=1 Tax=Ancylostoma caninum TaxID=29170 RepID=A0A368F3M5_ANCCA|nr:hypothetical protein ANCCAN_27569 [Ancylostoma caninum]
MRALRALLALLLAILATTQAFMIDGDEYSGLVDYPLPKRSFQHIWRNIQMQMPGSQKRTESLSRARANAYYRLG